MGDISRIVESFCASVTAAAPATVPFRYWLPRDILPEAEAEAVCALPIAPPAITSTAGKRETNNATRLFFCEDSRARFPVCERIAQALQHPKATGTLESHCGVALKGTNLRIEYCQDTGSFWLEPHKDIVEKKVTLLIYLSRGPEAESWGTDIYDGSLARVATAPCGFNLGLIFLPGADTWHGFEKRTITGVRRSLIVNYVTPAWRARHELSFRDRPVGSA